MDQNFSELLKTDKCSPLIVYGIIVVITAVCIYNVKTDFSKFGDNHKIKNISDMFMWYELALLLITGVLMFGLCQYNENTMAWSVLFAPLVAYTAKTILVFWSVSSMQKVVPPDVNVQTVNSAQTSQAIQNALSQQMKQQAAIQTPQQQVLPSQRLGSNAVPGMVKPLNSDYNLL